MPKNVVGRLLHLENEMKNVLSICEISQNENKTSKGTQKKSKTQIRSSLTNADHKRCGYPRMMDKRASCINGKVLDRSYLEKKSSEIHRKRLLSDKPSSAPPFRLYQLPEGDKTMTKHSTLQSPKKGEGAGSAESSEWFDCSPLGNDATEHTLRPPEDILNDISHYGNENYIPKRSMAWCGSCSRRSSECGCHQRPRWSSRYHLRTSDDDQPENSDGRNERNSFGRHVKSDMKDDVVINELVRQIEEKELEAMAGKHEGFRKSINRTRYRCESRSEAKIAKTANEGGQPEDLLFRPDATNAVSMNMRCNRRPMTAPAKSRVGITYSDRRENNYRSEDEEDITLREKTVKDNFDFELLKEKGNIHSVTDLIDKGNYVQWIDDVLDEQRESASDAESSYKVLEDLEGLKKKKILSEVTVLRVAEAIQHNNLRVEKIKRERFLALNTIKSMEEKYSALDEKKNELMKKLEELVEKNEKLVKELQQAEEEKKKMCEELEARKKMQMSDHLMMDKLQSVEEENEKYKEKIEYLENELQEKIRSEEERTKNTELAEMSESSQMSRDRCYEYHLLFRRQEAAYRKLVEGIAVLEKVIRNNKEKEKRLCDIKAELKRRAVKMQCYLEKLTAEKVDLFQVVNDLRAFVEEHQSKIGQLEEELKKKDAELEKEKKLVVEKNGTLEETNRELESIRKNSNDLEEQVKMLRKSIEQFDQMHSNLLKERNGFEEIIQKVTEENVHLQEQISNEADSILIKEKIIEDQQETIKQLKEKSDEAKTMAQKIQSLERLLDTERGDKLELQETVERLRRKKEELNQRVKSLEADLLLAPQEVVRDLQKTQLVLHELENQVQTKQKEWEILLQSLAREKEQACSVAVFATNKLIQTTSDFQRQSDAHKQLYKILTENLMEKKRHLVEATEKAKQNVRFSENLQQEWCETFDERDVRNSDMHRCQIKQSGILKKSRDWCDQLPECHNICRGKSTWKFEEDLE